MLIGGFKLRISVRSAWKLAKWNRFRAQGGRRGRIFPRLRPFVLKSSLVTLLPFARLNANHFQITAGVDSDEVSAQNGKGNT
jgi:hypothetical protein